MAFPKTFAGAAGTDLASAGVGAVKVSSDTGSFKTSGFGRIYRSSTSSVGYRFTSDVPTDKNYKGKLGLFTSSLTLVERIGITVRDTGSSLATRTMVWARVRNTTTALYVELYKCINNVFTLVATSANLLPSIAADTDYELVLIANEDQFSVTWGGTEVITPQTISDAALQNIGVVGMYSSGDATAATAGTSSTNGTGIHVTYIDMEYLSASGTISGSLTDITLESPTGSLSVAGSAGYLSGSLSEITLESPTGSLSTGSPLAVQEFFGSNVHVGNSIVTNGNTATPAVSIAIRNPEGGTPIWQHFRFALFNDSSITKTASISISLADEESQTNTVRASWSGPFRATTLTDIDAWSPISRTAAGGILTFDVVVGPGETVYVCSMPPGIRPQVEDWIAKLVAAHPSMIHDDLPARVAAGIGPYACDTAPTVVDEFGRTISGEPMMGFRVGNDAYGVPSLKRQFCLFAMLHPGEDHGLIQLRGCLDRWLNDPAFATLRNNVDLIVHPIGAPHGTKGGYRRYEPRVGLPTGDNLNREWKPSTLNGTAQKWQTILNTNFGSTFPRVKALIDFHDLSASSQVVYYYYRPESANISALRTVVEAVFPSSASVPSTNDSTTTDYFVNTKGVSAAMTAEVSDQATSLAGFTDVGRNWASVLKGWNDAGLIGTDPAVLSGALSEITLASPAGSMSGGGAAGYLQGFIPELVLESIDGELVSGSGGSSGVTADQVVDALLNRELEGGITVEGVLKILLAGIAGDMSSPSQSERVFKSVDGSRTRIAASVNSNSRNVTLLDGS